MAQFSSFQKWLRLKKYHFELSVGIYMMQPGEKLAICMFLLVAPLSLAALARSGAEAGASVRRCSWA